MEKLQFNAIVATIYLNMLENSKKDMSKADYKKLRNQIIDEYHKYLEEHKDDNIQSNI